MCSSAIVSLVAQGIGGGLSAHAGMEASQAEQSKLRFESLVALNNAQLAERDIALTQEEADVSKQETALDIEELRGQARTSFASGNVLLDEGSAARFDQAALEESKRQQAAIQQQADIEKARFGQERQSLIAEAGQLRKAAKTRKRTGRLAATAQLFGTASSVAGQAGNLRATRRQQELRRGER